jgi:hypothetical protein
MTSVQNSSCSYYYCIVIKIKFLLPRSDERHMTHKGSYYLVELTLLLFIGESVMCRTRNYVDFCL